LQSNESALVLAVIQRTSNVARLCILLTKNKIAWITMTYNTKISSDLITVSAIDLICLSSVHELIKLRIYIDRYVKRWMCVTTNYYCYVMKTVTLSSKILTHSWS